MKITNKTSATKETELKAGMYFFDTMSQQYYICVHDTHNDELYLYDLNDGEPYSDRCFDGYNLDSLFRDEDMLLINAKELVFK